MGKIVLITGSTDGIGLVTAKSYLKLGHTVLLHGRSAGKLQSAKQELSQYAASADSLETYQADLSILAEVAKLANDVKQKHNNLDVLINNAGVYVVPETVSADGLDVRFAVNTIAPYLLTTLLLPVMTTQGRVVNLSSAAQAPVQATELTKPSTLPDNSVYAKSKLAITMWSFDLAKTLMSKGPAIIAVNPKSLLGSKMVKKAYGMQGSNIQVGADVLVAAGLSDAFASASGKYYDNDIEQFAPPHPDALNTQKTADIVAAIEPLIKAYL